MTGGLQLGRLRSGQRYGVRRPRRHHGELRGGADGDGDSTLDEQDCAPDNAAIHPGVGEIVGDTVRRGLQGRSAVPARRVAGLLQHQPQGECGQVRRVHRRRTQDGDKVQIRCTSKAGLPPSPPKTITAKAGKRTVPGAVVLQEALSEEGRGGGGAPTRRTRWGRARSSRSSRTETSSSSCCA